MSLLWARILRKKMDKIYELKYDGGLMLVNLSQVSYIKLDKKVIKIHFINGSTHRTEYCSLEFAQKNFDELKELWI